MRLMEDGNLKPIILQTNTQFKKRSSRIHNIFKKIYTLLTLNITRDTHNIFKELFYYFLEVINMHTDRCQIMK